MKLRNKKTGEIVEFENITRVFKFIGNQNTYDSLAELNEEWEDHKEPKDNNYWFIDDFGRIQFSSEILEEVEGHPNNWMARKLFGNYFTTKEEAEKAVEKLKAWKRLKDKGFRFLCWNHDYTIDFTINGQNTAPFELDELSRDLMLLFGGEE